MNKWLKKLKKKAILPAAAFLVAAAAIGTTFAWQQWDLSITNNLTAHNVIITETEKFTPNDGTKEVTFTNTGDASVFLRVAYSEYWLSGETGVTDEIKQGPHWKGESNTTTLLPNIVDGKEIAEKDWDPSWPDSPAKMTKDWFKAPDGWYYYKLVLSAGEPSGTILHHVYFPSVPSGYDTANYRLYFKAEVVQCSDGINTLNSEAVNKNATGQLFHRKAKVNPDGRVIWEGESEWSE